MSKSKERNLAIQIAGSCNLSGIDVSSQDIERIEKIISGELSSREIRQRLVHEYKTQNDILVEKK
tara:strand:- start:119 stop:313 length:195 start_codon:yes stop_codon:yes gene_type:complete